ncbi:MAG: thiamine phosphate synthase [Algisphaera sp.]
MPFVSRILDANANRAHEALRTMEEAARFLLNDTALSHDLKQLRHDLSSALATLPDLPLHRDTLGDVGTVISTPAEASRQSTTDVTTAAGNRLTQALRVLEEYGKLLPAPPPIEPLRYRAYELQRRLHTALKPTQPQQWRLCLLLTQSLCHLPWQEVLHAAVDHGADCIQVREKEMTAKQLLNHVQDVVQRVGQHATIIVNDRPDIAAAAGAHGVHLGQNDLPCQTVRKLFGHQLIIGVSTFCLDEAQQAADAGANYCGVGPMFPTTTKHKPVLAGPPYLRDYIAWSGPSGLPHLAIGGITPNNIHTLNNMGCQGIAVSSAICSAQAPAQATQDLLRTQSQGKHDA